MKMMTLGRTGLEISRTGFGALPIQRVDFETVKVILRRAYEAGITFFDTARAYSDSEEKIGYSLSDVRKDIVIATKSHAESRAELLEHIQTSLKNLKTDYVDILQLHNPGQLPDPDDRESVYAGLLEAREKGMARFISVTCHSYDNAVTAVESGLYDTVQYPLSHISNDRDLSIVDRCREKNIGLIGMKALCGGIITNARVAFQFLRQFDNLVPIWGVQRLEELEEFIELDANTPELNEDSWAAIFRDREELAQDFCRACGYCLPCPVDIPIPMAARMGLLLRRAPSAQFLTAEWQEIMGRIENCIECGACASRCPYGLDTPNLLKRMYKNYREFLAEHGS